MLSINTTVTRYRAIDPTEPKLTLFRAADKLARSMTERISHDRRIMEEAHYRLLRLLQDEPQLSQREIAQRLGVSLGKVNYCVQALAEKGWLKAGNFYRSRNKRAYLYKLTPRGIAEKAAMTARFLRRKEAEHRALLSEIKMLRQEMKATLVNQQAE
jgi:EPS-associated MarR family transcriptional regulator